MALAALVYGTTNSAIAGALTFVAATLPNLLFGPLAGVLVDRWDQKRVLIASDLLRAGIVLLIPAGVGVNVVLAYPLVFLLTTVSIFFRPARTAVIPRVVREDELVTANSATWLSETLADVVGLPVGGPVRGVPRERAAAGVLARLGVVRGVGPAGGRGRDPAGGPLGRVRRARPRGWPASATTWRPAGDSFAASPSSSRTRCRRSPAS